MANEPYDELSHLDYKLHDVVTKVAESLDGLASQTGDSQGRAIESLESMSGFQQVALRLGLNGLWPQGLKEYSVSYLTSDCLRPIFGSKCLVTQTMGSYLGLGPLEETLEKMFQVATRTFNLLYHFPYM
jgi:hypothetical protein